MTFQDSGPSVYLAGPIEAATDEGRGWREKLAPRLHRLGVTPIIPNDFNKEKELPQEEWKRLKKEDISLFKKEFRQRILVPDLQLVTDSSFIILYYDGTPTSGTHHEAGSAWEMAIPIFIVTPLQYHELPSWLLACSTEEFHDFDSLMEFVEEYLQDESIII